MMNKYIIIFAAVLGVIATLAMVFETNLVISDGTKVQNLDEPRLEVLMTVETITDRYDYAFRTCAGKERIENPIIIISTDSEEKTIRSIRTLESEQCYVTGTTIKAQNPSSITLSISDEPAKKLPDNEQIDKLVSQLKAKNKKLTALLAQDPGSKDFEAKFDSLIQDISSIRQEIKTLSNP